MFFRIIVFQKYAYWSQLPDEVRIFFLRLPISNWFLHQFLFFLLLLSFVFYLLIYAS
jgi:hypothetical protein